MKVIHITATIKRGNIEKHPKAGWVTTIAEKYLEAFPDSSEIEIWQVSDEIISLKEVNHGGIKYLFFPGKIEFQNYANSNDLLEFILSEANGDDIFHIHGQLRAVVYEFVKLYAEKFPVLFSFWGPLNPKQIEWHDKRINNINQITYCNNFAMKQLQQNYNHIIESLTVGTNFNFFKKLEKSEIRKKINIDNNRFVMISVARFVTWKNIDLFIDVLNDIEEDFLFLLVGDGPMESELRDKSKDLIKKDKIRFLGTFQRESEELLESLNAADLFVITSKGEGASGAVMEAMACELPIFSTNFGGTADFLDKQKKGVLVEVEATEKWKESIKKIINKEIIAEPLDRKIAEKEYSWVNITKRMNEIYLSIIKNNS